MVIFVTFSKNAVTEENYEATNMVAPFVVEAFNGTVLTLTSLVLAKIAVGYESVIGITTYCAAVPSPRFEKIGNFKLKLNYPYDFSGVISVSANERIRIMWNYAKIQYEPAKPLLFNLPSSLI